MAIKYSAKCDQIRDKVYKVYENKRKYTILRQFNKILNFCISKYLYIFLNGFRERHTRF